MISATTPVADLETELAEKFVLPDGTYPLRGSCRGWNEGMVPCIQCQSTPGQWSCQGESYVYNDAPDALTEAVRAKGWDYKIVSFKDGDYAMIRGCMVNGTRDRGVVIPDEELRGYEALKLAVCRMMEAE